MSDDNDKILAALFRRLLEDGGYWDTQGAPAYGSGKRRLCVDGTLYDVTAEELAALDRAFPPSEFP